MTDEPMIQTIFKVICPFRFFRPHDFWQLKHVALVDGCVALVDGCVALVDGWKMVRVYSSLKKKAKIQ